MTNVPKSRQDQQKDFENGKYPFPAKKKNNWSVGAQIGVPFVAGDLNVRTPIPGFGGGLNVRKAFGHTFSARFQGIYGTTYGIGGNPSSPALNYVNDAVNGKNNPKANYYNKDGQSSPFFNNFKMNALDVSVQGMVHANNINFYRKQTRWGVYGFAGFGLFAYRTRINALNGDQMYDFSGEVTKLSNGTKEKQIIKDVQKKLDNTYETNGTSFSANGNEYHRRYMWTAGAGLAYRLNRRVDLTLEHRISWVTTTTWITRSTPAALVRP